MQAIGGFIGRMVVWTFQAIVAIVRAFNGALVAQFGQNNTYAGYVVAALITYAYVSGTLGVLIGQVFVVLQQLAVVALMILGLVVIFRGVFGRR